MMRASMGLLSTVGNIVLSSFAGTCSLENCNMIKYLHNCINMQYLNEEKFFIAIRAFCITLFIIFVPIRSNINKV